MPSNYRIGRSHEYLIMSHLRKMGAIDVTRSYGSHGIVDVRAIFPNKVLLIQAKPKYISKKERASLIKFASGFRISLIHVMIWCFDKKTREWNIEDLSESWRQPMSLRQFKRLYGLIQELNC